MTSEFLVRRRATEIGNQKGRNKKSLRPPTGANKNVWWLYNIDILSVYYYCYFLKTAPRRTVIRSMLRCFYYVFVSLHVLQVS